MLDFLDIFSQLLNTSEEQIFYDKFFYHLILERLQNTQPTKSLTWKTTPAVAKDFMFCYAEYLKLSK